MLRILRFPDISVNRFLLKSKRTCNLWYVIRRPTAVTNIIILDHECFNIAWIYNDHIIKACRPGRRLSVESTGITACVRAAICRCAFMDKTYRIISRRGHGKCGRCSVWNNGACNIYSRINQINKHRGANGECAVIVYYYPGRIARRACRGYCCGWSGCCGPWR